MDSELLQRGFVPQSLTPAQCSELDTNGFIILEGIIAPAWLAELRRAFDAIFAREGDKAGVEVSQVEGVRRLADLVNKGTVFDAVYLQPTLLTAVFHVLQRPFKLHSLNGHDPLPGNGLQILHADWGPTHSARRAVPRRQLHVDARRFHRSQRRDPLRPRQPPQIWQNYRLHGRPLGRSPRASVANGPRWLGRRVQRQPLA